MAVVTTLDKTASVNIVAYYMFSTRYVHKNGSA